MKNLEKKRPAGMSRNRFCKLLNVNRSTLYYTPKEESRKNKTLKKMMMEHYNLHPTAGVLGMRDMLHLNGYTVNVKRVRRLMREMGLKAIYPEKKLSTLGSAQYVHPYLLRGLDINRPNQVWSTDISYIRMSCGFMYLYAIIDVYSRYIVGWRLSNTLEKSNCLELLEECVQKNGKPEIVNTDQGSQYTSPDWVRMLSEHGIRISMDGRGRCKDNIWIERFWRTVKQEYVYRYPTDDVTKLREGIKDYIAYYNEQRPHQGLKSDVPDVPSKRYHAHCAA